MHEDATGRNVAEILTWPPGEKGQLHCRRRYIELCTCFLTRSSSSLHLKIGLQTIDVPQLHLTPTHTYNLFVVSHTIIKAKERAMLLFPSVFYILCTLCHSAEQSIFSCPISRNGQFSAHLTIWSSSLTVLRNSQILTIPQNGSFCHQGVTYVC